MAYIAHPSAILFLLITCLIASVVFCVKFFFLDFDGAVYAFMFSMGGFGAVYTLSAAISMRHQIGGIFSSLTSIYNTRKFDHFANEKHSIW